MPDYFVIFFSPERNEYIALGEQAGATDGSAANGVAAVNNGESGKYVAFDISTGTVEHVDVALAATSSSTTF